MLVDLQLLDGVGFDLFVDLDPRSAAVFVVITGHATVESAVDALKAALKALNQSIFNP
ncbi:hypothetical protein [Paraburkholderia sp. PGU19]|uniref:hypothetical protein n=1 Tax=Paraburkholderia sp. PGU19 TaxID=2735434 RepID=UPI0031F81FF6